MGAYERDKTFFAFIQYSPDTLPRGIFLVEILLSSLRSSHSFIIMAVFEPLRACLEGKDVFFFCYRDHLLHVAYATASPRFILQRLSAQSGEGNFFKTVAQAMSNYVMNLYLFLLDLCRELERMIISFWWGNNRSGNRGVN